MNESLQRFLSLRGIHYLVTRFGWNKLRSLSFDGKFQKGDWRFSAENPDLIQLVESYCSHGHILALGCGSAPIASLLNTAAYESFLGLDLSQVAIAIANKQANAKIRFQVDNMVKYTCTRSYDVILFPDSFYYVRWGMRKILLKRLAKNLTPSGRIILSIAQPIRYAAILTMIRRNFQPDVDRALRNTDGHVIVFR